MAAVARAAKKGRAEVFSRCEFDLAHMLRFPMIAVDFLLIEHKIHHDHEDAARRGGGRLAVFPRDAGSARRYGARWRVTSGSYARIACGRAETGHCWLPKPRSVRRARG